MLYRILTIFAVIWAIFMFGIVPVALIALGIGWLYLSKLAYEEKYGKSYSADDIEDMLKNLTEDTVRK